MEAARQDVQEKAADELGGVERHGPEPVAAFDPVVLPLEGDARLVERAAKRAGLRASDDGTGAGGYREGAGALRLQNPSNRGTDQRFRLTKAKNI